MPIGIIEVKFANIRWSDEQIGYAPKKYYPTNPGALLTFGSFINIGGIGAFSTEQSEYDNYIESHRGFFADATGNIRQRDFTNFMYAQGMKPNDCPYYLTFNKFFNFERNRFGRILKDVSRPSSSTVTIGVSWEKDITDFENYNSLPNGNYTLKVRLIDDKHSAGEFSNGVSFSKLPFYNIATTLHNIKAIDGNKDKVMQSSFVELYYEAESGYSLPETISVTNATYEWTQSTGKLKISNPTGNVSITISVPTKYSITPTLTNVTAGESNPTIIEENGIATLTYTADGTNYKVPTTAPTVTGATSTYNRVSDTECIITLSNSTEDVLFTVTGEAII